MAKTQFLTFEIHLNDSAQVAALQATTTAPGVRPIIEAGKLFEAPYNATAPGYGAAVDYGTPAVPILPMIGPGTAPPIGTPYLFSEWFTSSNNFPRDFASFTRKSGGWFGIPFLFGTTTRYYWRAVFVYDAPQDAATGGPLGVPRAALAQRRWIDTFHMFPGQAVTESGIQSSGQARWMSRDAGRAVDGFGFAMRGSSGTRLKSIAGDVAGTTARESWERLYIRIRKLPSVEVQFWRSRGASNESGAILKIAPSGQITAYNSNNIATITLIGASSGSPLVVGRWYKFDILCQYNLENAVSPSAGSLSLFLNGVQALTASISDAVGGLGQLACGHVSSELGTTVDGHSLHLDIGYWHNANVPTLAGLAINAVRSALVAVNLTGLDWINGSRGIIIRPNGNAAAFANWSTPSFRKLGQRPGRDGDTTIEGALSTTASAVLAVTTDVDQSVKAVPGALGLVCAYPVMFSHKGANNGTLGYRIPPAGAATLAAISQNGGTTWGWNGYGLKIMPAVNATQPIDVTGLELHHVKGADVTQSDVAILAAEAELIGTFGDEDYAPGTDPALVLPLPDHGKHNAPYPRTPWARASAPPISPVVVISGSYAGNSTEQDLQFTAPVHWMFIRRVATSPGSPKTVRWWSSRIAAGRANEQSPHPDFLPDQLIDPTFVVAAVTPPTGVGAFPDRSAQIPAIVAANIGLLDGNDNHKRDLCGIIARALNVNNPGDGNNWGLLEKTDRVPPFVATDILVWKPTLDHVDVLTDTGATWSPDGIITNPAWLWKDPGNGEGSQEQRSVIRIGGSSIEVNQTGQTYQYIAVCDPGGRYMLNGVHINRTENISGFVHTLINSGFTPIWGFFQDERPGFAIGAVSAMKGPGNTAAAITRHDGANLTPAVTFGAGALTMGTAAVLSANDVQLAFSLWRGVEPTSTDPGRFDVVRIVTYTGNGAGGTRTIGLGTPTGKRPLFCIVQPAAAYGYFKDAAHAGGNSTSLQDGSQAITSIVSGGLDEIVIGSTLNTNLVVYNVFAIMGGAAGGGDGFSNPGVFVPVEPDYPADGPWGPAPGAPAEDPDDPGGAGGGDDPGADTPGAPGGGTDDIDKDLLAACLPFTTRVVNIALSRIGISQPIGLLASENSEPAQLCRLHLGSAIEHTLRDFPWPFATRYADLVLLAGSVGSPVNRDWTYSYQQPADCIFERRIVVVRDGAVDPTPPPFQLSYDNLLGVRRILTNQAEPCRLEYTARPECSAGRGDPLFRDALAWRLAWQIAGPLTKIEGVMKHCQDSYDAAIAKAQQVLRPGNPGPKTTLDPNLLDQGTGAAAANIGVVNLALLRIGARPVANLDQDQSREANAARLIFEAELLQVLRAHPWAFATAYEAAPTFVAGTTTVPANDDWTYAYRYPSDAVFIRRIVDELRRSRADRQPEMHRVGQDATGKLIFCDRLNPTFEYTARIANCVLMSDALFRDAFAWKLASSLAPTLAQVDPDETEQLGRGVQDRPRERKPTEAQLRDRMAQRALQLYQRAIVAAQVADLNEKQEDPNDGEADWIIGRD